MLAFSVSGAQATWNQLAQLTASDGMMFDGFGEFVSMSGNTIVVAAPDAEAAYVFVKPQSGWTDMTQVAKLTASDGQRDLFGISVSISGDTIVVGAACTTVNGNYCQGAADVFVKPAGGWTDMTESAQLTTSDGKEGDEAGLTVSVDGDTIAIGAPFKTKGKSHYAGEVYVYTKPSGGWANATETAKFLGEGQGGKNLGIELGSTVALGHDTLVAGASGCCRHSYLGSIFVYPKASDGWKYTKQAASLVASKKVIGSELGDVVAVSSDGNTILAGAPDFDSKISRTLIFVKPASGWQGARFETAVLSDGAGPTDEFGDAVGISGNSVIVGSWSYSNPGAAYVFVKPAKGWKTTHRFQAELMASGETQGWTFGASVAIDGSTSVVGASSWNSQGAAFVFGKTGR